MWRRCLVVGEVHLETVIKDLKERFARIQLQVSPPLVAFRESVFLQSEAPEAVFKAPKVNSSTRLQKNIGILLLHLLQLEFSV